MAVVSFADIIFDFAVRLTTLSGPEYNPRAMKTALVSFYESYPPTSGSAIVSYSVARFLPGERLLVQVTNRGGSEEPEPGLRVESIASPAGSSAAKIIRLPGRLRAIARTIRSFGPDAVLLEGASWAVFHWLLFRTLRRKLPGIPVYYHAHNVEYDLRRGHKAHLSAAMSHWAEGMLIKKSAAAFAVSDVDIRRFKELYGVEPELLPNGVDVARFDSATEAQAEALRSRLGLGRHCILFMGLYAYPPNTMAVQFLATEVMPRLLRTHPDAELVVTGGDVPMRFPWLKNPGILPFDEVPALLQACCVATAPIFLGSGTRLKILEAMAAGAVVVATPKGAEGISVEDGRGILLARDGEEFAQKIRRVWDEPGLGETLIAEARQFVLERFDWPVCLEALLARLRENAPPRL